jgi:hypothetical protein
LEKKEKRGEFDLTSLPKFKGSISASFEMFLKPYYDSEEEELRKNIINALQQDQLNTQS